MSKKAEAQRKDFIKLVLQIGDSLNPKKDNSPWRKLEWAIDGLCEFLSKLGVDEQARHCFVRVLDAQIEDSRSKRDGAVSQFSAALRIGRIYREHLVNGLKHAGHEEIEKTARKISQEVLGIIWSTLLLKHKDPGKASKAFDRVVDYFQDRFSWLLKADSK